MSELDEAIKYLEENADGQGKGFAEAIRMLREMRSRREYPWKQVVDILNQRLGTKYRYSAGNKAKICARFKEGYTIDDFRTVIHKKAQEWLGTDMEKYLRPETLFSLAHFESYLNQIQTARRKNSVSEFFGGS